MSNQLSVVIPLGSGSRMQNLELKYCLRSIEKYLTGVKNIIIVGEKPAFLNLDEIIHLPKKDTARKQESIKRKIEAAFNHPECTENVAFWNDDYILMQETEVSKIKNYYWKDLGRVSEKGAIHLRRDLVKKKLPLRHYDIHYPILYNKAMFKEAMSHFEWVDRDFVIKSLYGNFHKLEGEEMQDSKPSLSRQLAYGEIKESIRGRWLFSYSDDCFKQPMIRLLNELFPEPSRFELVNQQNKAA